MSILENFALVQSQIISACARVHRNPADVTLVAVSKQHPVSDILAVYEVGHRHFGENRLEEMREKMPSLTDKPIHWHMIGHIQSRKARDIPAYFQTVHSVDSLHLAQKLDNATQKAEKPYLEVLLQINISGEESKSGLSGVNWAQNADTRAILWDEIRQIIALPHLRVRGLMTMAFIADNPEDTRPVFISLRNLRDALMNDLGVDLPHLSMGMTDDFMVAIEEGATIIRVGRAIFGG
ncbi:MAG: YggS family pyridoxal phosphate-dependent enzyme [Anaerolineae bacterium]|jgi:hypothetical protein|nr:YggS family pyridoxal phosphate-dependent enzyme [Anaerolineae bacterium]